MARLLRAVDLRDALTMINEAAQGMTAEEKRGMRAAVKAFVRCASVAARNVVFAESKNGKCSACGNGIGYTYEWCPSCGALLDLKLQHYMTDQTVSLKKEYENMLRRLGE